MAKAKSRANGDADVFPRRNAKGEITSYRGAYFGPDGKRRYVSGKTKTEARAALAKARADAAGGLVLDTGKVTVAEYLNRWLDGPLRTKGLKATTEESYRRQVRVHIAPAIGGVKLSRLTPELLQDLYDAKIAAGLKPATVRLIHAVLYNALEHAHRRRHVAENAAARTTPPVPRQGEMRPLNAQQVRTLLQRARETEDRLEALLVLAATAGLRIGELMALRWDDLDGDTLRVARTLSRAKSGPRYTTPKNGHGRSVVLTDRAIEALKRHRVCQNAERLKAGASWTNEDLIFCNPTGAPLNRNKVDEAHLQPLLKQAALPRITPHDLRHTCATLLLSRGVHPKFVQELLGHSSVAMTIDRYSHWIPSMGDQTARAMEAALG